MLDPISHWARSNWCYPFFNFLSPSSNLRYIKINVYGTICCNGLFVYDQTKMYLMSVMVIFVISVLVLLLGEMTSHPGLYFDRHCHLEHQIHQIPFHDTLQREIAETVSEALLSQLHVSTARDAWEHHHQGRGLLTPSPRVRPMSWRPGYGWGRWMGTSNQGKITDMSKGKIVYNTNI